MEEFQELIQIDSRIRQTSSTYTLHLDPWLSLTSPLGDRLAAVHDLLSIIISNSTVSSSPSRESLMLINTSFIRLAEAFQKSTNSHIRYAITCGFKQTQNCVKFISNSREIFVCILGVLTDPTSNAQARVNALKIIGYLASIVNDRPEVLFHIQQALSDTKDEVLLQTTLAAISKLYRYSDLVVKMTNNSVMDIIRNYEKYALETVRLAFLCFSNLKLASEHIDINSLFSKDVAMNFPFCLPYMARMACRDTAFLTILVKNIILITMDKRKSEDEKVLSATVQSLHIIASFWPKILIPHLPIISSMDLKSLDYGDLCAVLGKVLEKALDKPLEQKIVDNILYLVINTTNLTASSYHKLWACRLMLTLCKSIKYTNDDIIRISLDIISRDDLFQNTPYKRKFLLKLTLEMLITANVPSSSLLTFINQNSHPILFCLLGNLLESNMKMKQQDIQTIYSLISQMPDNEMLTATIGKVKCLVKIHLYQSTPEIQQHIKTCSLEIVRCDAWKGYQLAKFFLKYGLFSLAKSCYQILLDLHQLPTVYKIWIKTLHDICDIYERIHSVFLALGKQKPEDLAPISAAIDLLTSVKLVALKKVEVLSDTRMDTQMKHFDLMIAILVYVKTLASLLNWNSSEALPPLSTQYQNLIVHEKYMKIQEIFESYDYETRIKRLMSDCHLCFMRGDEIRRVLGFLMEHYRVLMRVSSEFFTIESCK